jgi:antitoxin component YwqK of YwqJK toxin-antitoxin module
MKKLFFIAFIITGLFSIAQTTDASGKKQGYWKQKDEKTNKLVYEGEFKDDKPVGKFKYYYPSDSVRAIIDFKKNGKTAYAKLFHPTGKRMGEGKYTYEALNAMNRDSIWLFYDDSGLLISKDKYINGKKEGVSYVYLPDGKVAEEKVYKADILNGPFKQYFDGKKLKGQGLYTNGLLEGKVSYYYPNGIEVATGYYINDRKNGPWIYKEESGKIKEKELYKEGKLASKKETEEFFNKNKPKETIKETPKESTPKKGVKK